jgi:DinB family protein
MAAKAKQGNALTTLLADRWEQVSRKIESLAEILPEDGIEKAPANGIRTYGAVLRHVAFWNQYVADSLNGNRTDDTSNELPLAQYSSKASALAALQRSSAAVGVALGGRKTSLDPKTTELIVTFLEHTSEHYGQLVVYSRLMGIVPVTSRG